MGLIKFLSRTVAIACLASLSQVVLAAADGADPAPAATAAVEPRIASSVGKDVGDHLLLTTDVWGFIPVSDDPGILSTPPRCAGKLSKFSRVGTAGTDTFVMFYYVHEPLSKETCTTWSGADAKQNLAAKGLVVEGTVYKISSARYAAISAKSNGLAFGALLVPFKFRLGSDAKVVSSATVAPYIGLRWRGFQGFGFEGMPVISAGLGIVPISDPATKKTETRAAFSTAIGFTVSSSKNADFSAGVLLGKDFLGKSDRLIDPSVSKAWVSIWVGVSK
ncbi:MAG: hypothetical protein H7176_10280 [Bdellovibrionales bacterium]|nr:hypothetical protein [Massilia sp.]